MIVSKDIEEFQQTQREIGMIQFMEASLAREAFPHSVPAGYYPIGVAEAELLCIEEATGQPVLLEHEVAGRIACRCAGTQCELLAALRILDAYFSLCGEDDGLADDERIGLDASSRATAAAGGSEYEGFYRSLVGF